jgi:hypothetical protein
VNVQTISGDAEGQARTTLSASPDMTKESIDSAAENLDSREQNLSGPHEKLRSVETKVGGGR